MSAIAAEVEQLQDTSPCETVVRPKRPRAGRQPLPDHLPRIEHRHEPESCTCGKCGKDLVKIGEDISEQLDVEPAKFFVHRHIRERQGWRECSKCRSNLSSAICLPGLRNHHGGTDSAGGHRWWYGHRGFADLGDDQ